MPATDFGRYLSLLIRLLAQGAQASRNARPKVCKITAHLIDHAIPPLLVR
jgi:hypothetical protein